MAKSILLSFCLAGLIVPAVSAAEPIVTGTNRMGTAQTQPPVQKNQVRGQIVNEAGKPMVGAIWRIAGTEVLKDGKWTRELRSGDAADAFADAEGRFVISYGEPIRLTFNFTSPVMRRGSFMKSGLTRRI